jgi:hypothetical protein
MRVLPALIRDKQEVGQHVIGGVNEQQAGIRSGFSTNGAQVANSRLNHGTNVGIIAKRQSR